MRDMEIHTVRPADEPDVDLGPWAVLSNVHIESATLCEFDLAEEVIGLVSYVNGFHIVGIGEPLRPYEQVFDGFDGAAALAAFWKAVAEHAAI